MTFGERVKETIVNRAAEGLAISVSVIFIWVATKVGPAVLPALETSLSKSLLIYLLLASIGLNIAFAIIFWIFHKTPELTLKFGIYWDLKRNPHCPNCKIPIAGYSDYQNGRGYYCKPCNKVFPLQDSSGKDIEPSQAIAEL